MAKEMKKREKEINKNALMTHFIIFKQKKKYKRRITLAHLFIAFLQEKKTQTITFRPRLVALNSGKFIYFIVTMTIHDNEFTHRV